MNKHELYWILVHLAQDLKSAHDRLDSLLVENETEDMFIRMPLADALEHVREAHCSIEVLKGRLDNLRRDWVDEVHERNKTESENES